MPLYDYVCYACGSTFEKLRPMSDKDDDVRCPDCGSEHVERLLSTFFATGGCGNSGLSRFR